LKTVRGNIADEPFTEYMRPVNCFYVVLSAALHMRKFTRSSEFPEYMQWFSCLFAHF